MEKKYLIAMSGGVDSSVAASIVKNMGHDAFGITMKLYTPEDIYVDDLSSCCTQKDIEDAKSVAKTLNIPHYVINFSADFKKEVIDRFINAYAQGSTPNPCVDCNRHIKFKALFDQGKKMGADYIVTGHYARVEYNEKTNRYVLKKALDTSKDQSYVLYSLTQDQLKHTYLPLGELSKSEVRKIAEENSLLNYEKKESQDICFVPEGDYASFIEKYTGKTFPIGNFIDIDGNILGQHKGIIRYTIGQRKGLGLSFNCPMYVCNKCLEDNTVTLAKEENLFSNSLDANDLNLISVPKIADKMKVKARTRYNQKEQPATVWQTSDTTIHVEFDCPQRAITKGQAVVLYNDDEVVGGATIL